MKKSPVFLRTCQVLGLAVFCLTTATSLQASEPLRALLITGGCCHDYGEQLKILTNGISARANVTWTVLWEGGSSKGGTIRDHQMSIYAKKNWVEGYDVVVHNECFGDITNSEFVDHVAKAHFEGVPAVVIHCTMHSYRKASTDEWRKTLGVSSYNHEGARKFQVTDIKPDHPVMKGFPEKWDDPSPDELYRILKLWPNCIPLATASGKTNAVYPVVWVNTYGKGRIFGTTLGHSDETMSSPVYLDLITRGLLWACNDLDEDGKPKEGYGPASK